MAQKATATSTQATGTFEVKGWDEKTWDGKDHKEQTGAKLTHAIVNQDFHGDIEGTAKVQYLMSYREDNSASFVGFMNLTGLIGGRSGSAVLQINGAYENGTVTFTWAVIPGSGTGDLRGLRGEGRTVMNEGSTQPFTMDYYFE